MPIFDLLQHTSTVGASSLAFGSSVTAGSLIAINIGLYNGSVYTGCTVNGSAATLAINSQTGNFINSWWFFESAAGGSTTVAITGGSASGGGPSLAIFEISASEAYTIVASGMNSVTSNSPSDNPVSLVTVPLEVYVLFSCYDEHSSHTWGVTGSGFSLLEETSEPGGETLGVAGGDFTATVPQGALTGGTAGSQPMASLAIVASPTGGSTAPAVTCSMTGGLQ